MSGPEDTSLEFSRAQLEEKLRRVNEQLHKEMLARGFDPAQDGNLALTGPLAKLYLEREELLDELGAKLDMLSRCEHFSGERDES
jgi:hypothetical protein